MTVNLPAYTEQMDGKKSKRCKFGKMCQLAYNMVGQGTVPEDVIHEIRQYSQNTKTFLCGSSLVLHGMSENECEQGKQNKDIQNGRNRLPDCVL